MSGICLPIDASAGSPSFPAAQHRVAQTALMNPYDNTRPLGSRSGFRPGGEPTVTVTSTTWTVTPFTCIVDPLTGLTVGPYLVAFLANETGSVNAADATYSRLDRLDVVVPDDPPIGTRAATVVYTVGTPSATPVAPAAPARSFNLGTITVPKSGTGSPSWTQNTVYSVASGGVLPVTQASQRPTAPYWGQVIADVTAGSLLRWDGTKWLSVEPVINLYTGTPTAASLTTGTLGTNVISTLPTAAYPTLITVTFGAYINQATPADVADLKLRLNGSDTIACRTSGSYSTPSGSWAFTVAANTAPPSIQVVLTKVTGTGNTATGSGATSNWLQAVVVAL